jgi:hypothetical protein
MTVSIMPSEDFTLEVRTTLGGTIGGTLPAGSVIFAGLGDTLDTDQANFFYNKSQTRLGIGTGSPGYTLEVARTYGAIASDRTLSRFVITQTHGENGYERVALWAEANGNFTTGTPGFDWLEAVRGDTSSFGAGYGVSNISGFITNALVGGNHTVAARHGLYVADATLVDGTSFLGDQYGVFVNELLGGSNNFAIYTDGSTPSVFNGKVSAGGDWGTASILEAGRNVGATGAARSTLYAQLRASAADSFPRRAITAEAIAQHSSSGVNDLEGVYSSVSGSFTGGTVTGAYNFRAGASLTGGTVGTRYGLLVEDNTVGAVVGSQFGVYIDVLTNATTNWGVYSSAGSNNYFGGKVLIGTTTPTGAILRANGDAEFTGNISIGTDTSYASAITIEKTYGTLAADIWAVDQRVTASSADAGYTRGGMSSYITDASSSGWLSYLIGFRSDLWMTSTSNLTAAWGYHSAFTINNASYCTQRRAFSIASAAVSGGGSLDVQYGIYSEVLAGASQNWFLYSLGGNSWHVGKFQIGGFSTAYTAQYNLTVNGGTANARANTAGTQIHAIGPDTDNSIILVDCFATGATYIPAIEFRRANGTNASPSAVQSNNAIMSLRANGYGASTYGNPRISVSGLATENWTNSAQGSKIIISTTPTGTTTLNSVLTVENDGMLSNGMRTLDGKVPGIFFAQTADSQTTANSLTTMFGTGVGTLTMPANFLTVGRTITIDMFGVVKTSDGGAGTKTLALYVGGTAVATGTSGATITQVASNAWYARAQFTCRSTGAAGSIEAGACYQTQIAQAYPVGVIIPTATATVNTTGTLAVDLRFNNGNATGDILTKTAIVRWNY